MKSHEELFDLARQLQEAARPADLTEIAEPLKALEVATSQVERSFSGSWLGYHAYVYYNGFAPPPPGAHFSQEWGLGGEEWLGLSSRGDWREFDPEDVRRFIFKNAGEPNLDTARKASVVAADKFRSLKSEITSILATEYANERDQFLDKLRQEIEELEPLSKTDVTQRFAPQRKFMTRDTTALGQGTRVPPHIAVISEITSIRHSFGICKLAAEVALRAASHIERKGRRKRVDERIGTNVFIGHGRSQMWRELKDFIQERMKLPWDEFNRVPVAGVTNIARLSEMLDAAAIAFLVMTAEDEMVDGSLQARMNVVHEAGLFQGRLGFTRAIVILEDGCEEFSNIQGLGQIRFPKGRISAVFEEVRRVLEREKLVEAER